MNKRPMKLKLLPLLTAAIMLTGCSGNGRPAETVTEPVEISLSWWGNDARHEYMLEAVAQFEKLHPEIDVKCSYTEWSGYQTRSDVLMRSGTEADVMLINYAWIEKYSSDGNGYYDLNTLSDVIDLSNFGEYELNFGMKNGRLNAVPIAMNTQTLYINKTVYEKYGLEIPENWDDLFEAAMVMNGEAYPVAMTAKSLFFFVTAYAEQVCGKQFMQQDGRVSFTDEDFKIMLEMYCRMVNEKVMPQVEYFDRKEINSGKYAGTLAWLSDGSAYFDKAVENGYEFVIADYPAAEGCSSGDGWYAKPATMYAVSKNTNHPEQAALLLDFLLNSPEAAQLQGVEKGIPLSNSARTYLSEHDMLNGMQYEAFKKMEEYDELSVLSPYYENDDLIDEFMEACNKVYYDKEDLDEQAKYLHEEFSKVAEQ